MLVERWWKFELAGNAEVVGNFAKQLVDGSRADGRQHVLAIYI
jgi:hypothetical protein